MLANCEYALFGHFSFWAFGSRIFLTSVRNWSFATAHLILYYSSAQLSCRECGSLVKLLIYIYTKLCGSSLSIDSKNLGEYFALYLCITEIISAALNEGLFLLVMICRRRWPPRQQSPLLIYRDFWAFGHDFLKNLQFVHGDSPLCIVSTAENYLLWQWRRCTQRIAVHIAVSCFCKLFVNFSKILPTFPNFPVDK